MQVADHRRGHRGSADLQGASSIQELPGLLHYYVGIDRERGSVTNVSVWRTSADALRMDTLQPMLDQRPLLEAAGVTFEPITNHEVLWDITP